MSVTIQLLGPGNGARVRAIRLRALREAPDAFGTTLADAEARTAESWEDQLAELATFVATIGARDVGLVRGAPHAKLEDTAYLISMWVAPDVRRQGIALALVDAVVGWAKREGFAWLVLDVGEHNTAAAALYERVGFAPSGGVSQLPAPRQHVREIELAMPL